MKILHTADWHLGRQLCGVSLLADQRHALGQLYDVVENERPGVVIVAGDLYDRAIPPVDAIELFDEALYRLSVQLKVPVVMITGNHDSPERQRFATRMLETSGLHLRTSLADFARPIVIDGVEIYALPYTEPSEVRQFLGDETIHSHEAAARGILSSVEPGKDARRVLIAHAFVEGGAESDSERPLTVGGTGSVSAACYKAFDYVALGHLHKPQRISRDAVRYAGSLCKYSFSEEKHQKSFTIACIDKDGLGGVREIPIKPLREMRTIEGTFDEIKAAAPKDSARQDYLRIRLADAAPILEAKSRLERYYPNILEIIRPHFEISATTSSRTSAETRAMAPEELYRQFYKYIREEDLSPRQEEILQRVATSVMEAGT